ncbi:lipocalin family protein [Winogradskyella alexanderae]|uniref:Lipocalin-like domain-containing protein n=1 Tax=Winogradskyella alexanderae TaxID=2877123 RepID=A0ABS7XS89_9FLAO|nr:lipocalin family protein [Winogradskyella alexanderae]MCA0132249.1 hypothetical protein [Winogradskyella alexanderae]
MKRFLLLLFILLSSCTNNPENYLEHINGYWEIEEVVLPDGTKREYRINETIDYLKINDSLKGFRKKMKPGLNDTYYTSDDAEAIVARIENNKLILQYSTPYSIWEEVVLEANKERLKVVNEEKVVYLYKRYSPINLNLE